MNHDGRDIAAVVVSHYSATTLAECLDRLLAADGVGAVVVVDNASGDSSVAIARARAAADARLQVIANADNPGFGSACNQGAAHCALPWLVLVNPDCLVGADDLARLRELARQRADAGVIGADLVDVNGHRDSAARRRELTLARLFGGLGRRDAVAIAPDENLALQPVDAVSGALMLMPCALFDRLGGFDTHYRLHAEDLDLCRRVRDAGAQVYVANAVRVLHLRGVSSRRRPMWVEWQKHRGLWRYLRRFDPIAATLPGAVVAAVAVWLHFLLAAPLAWWRAWRSAR
jgi:GT2 family glycosyltransferase